MEKLILQAYIIINNTYQLLLLLSLLDIHLLYFSLGGYFFQCHPYLFLLLLSHSLTHSLTHSLMSSLPPPTGKLMIAFVFWKSTKGSRSKVQLNAGRSKKCSMKTKLKSAAITHMFHLNISTIMLSGSQSALLTCFEVYLHWVYLPLDSHLVFILFPIDKKKGKA